MSQVPFHYIDLRAFCYETEDEELVAEALQTLLPPDTELQREETSGHLGDRILILSVRLETADAIRTVIDRLRTGSVIDRIRGDLERRIDEDCALHLYLDKQAAVDGAVELGEGIAVRTKIEAYPATQENAIENARAAFRKDD